MTFTISFSNLWTYEVPNTSQRLPISAIPESGEAHVHGMLEIVVAGRKLPRMGYLGPDDVCFNEWANELVTAAHKLATKDDSEHVYDEGEQGQPAFQFKRVGTSVFVSIIASDLSGTSGMPSWQNIECQLCDFLSAIELFCKNLEQSLISAAPVGGKKWAKMILKTSDVE